MRVIVAPEPLDIQPNEISIFLAGGIQKTEEWQDEVINSLKETFADKPVVFLNPRRKNFPIHDKSAAGVQIKWEYDALDIADIFSMYFAGNTTSDQPICMYEYGKHLERRSNQDDMDRFVVSAEPTYSRYQDVIIQTELVNPDTWIGKSLEDHINSIAYVIKENLLARKLI